MSIELDVKKVMEELQQAEESLKSGNSFRAIINLESALSRLVSHSRNQEVVVAYVPE